MAAVHYTPEQRQRALGALAVAAHFIGQEWRPNYSVVARDLGISARTLKRWWEAQSETEVADLRRAASRARAKHLEGGARERLDAHLDGVEAVLSYCLDPIHYSTTLVPDHHYLDKEGKRRGSEVVYRVAGLPPQQAARTMQLCVEVVGDLRKLRAGGDQSGAGKVARLRRLADTLKKTRADERGSAPTPPAPDEAKP